MYLRSLLLAERSEIKPLRILSDDHNNGDGDQVFSNISHRARKTGWSPLSGMGWDYDGGLSHVLVMWSHLWRLFCYLVSFFPHI